MSRFLLIFIFSFLGFHLFPQDGPIYSSREEQKLFESGKSLFEEKLYPLAYEHFNKVLANHPRDLYLKYLTAICGIFISNKHEEAITYLSEIKNKNPKAADIDYYFALLYHKTYAFDKCIDLASQLLKDPNLEPVLKDKLNQAVEHSLNGKTLVLTKAETRIENIGGPPNTDGDEYSPVITSDEETMFFTYRGKLSKGGLRDSYDRPNKYGFYYEDIYMSKKEGGKWQEPVGLDGINTESNEAALAISNDGQQLFIYRAGENDGGDIYMSRLNGEGFGPAEKIKGEVNTGSWEGSITLSGDQKKIIFASDRPGGFGGKDLYQAVKTGDNTYKHVKNLGNLINTPYDEDAPFIHPDGRSLVFSSEGHNSMGDFDIFLSELDDTDSSWKKPLNVGHPINTPDDDIFYTLSANGKRGYFASAKPGGFGNKDIYVEEPVIFSKNSFLTVVKGKITENNVPYLCDINVLVGHDNHNYATYKSNSASGNYIVSLPTGRNYRVVFKHPAYGERVVDIDMDKYKSYSELLVDINFGEKAPATMEQAIVAGHIDSTRLAPSASTAGFGTGLASVTSAETPGLNKSTTSNQTYDLKKMTRAQLMTKFGEVKVNGLKYLVQVGAYRHPENYNTGQLKEICPVKRNGTIKGDVNLLVADKEFITWKEADLFLNGVKKAGQNDAFITADFNGKRCYIKDLLEMGVWANDAFITSR